MIKTLTQSDNIDQWRQFLRRFQQHRPAVLSAVILILLVILAIFGPWLVEITLNTDAFEIHPGLRNRPPSVEHPLGTDELGRDLLARVIEALRVSLVVGFLVVIVSNVIGIFYGAVTGSVGGALDTIMMLILDTMLSIPTFYLLLAITSYVANLTIIGIIVVVALTSWMGTARIVRADFIAIRQRDFVLAAEAIGASQRNITIRHILPNVAPTIVVASTLSVAHAILIESALSFLGLGVTAPYASLGTLLSRSQQYVWTAPRLAIIPGIVILVIVLVFNFIGDGLREALDPRLQGN